MFRFDKQGVLNDRTTAERLAVKIRETVEEGPGSMAMMHVCGTHEHTIAEAGIRSLLPASVDVISGPGCPVCVCHVDDIYKAIVLAEAGHVVATFGDMLRVPSPRGSMEAARARGLDVRVVYSIDDARAIAAENPDRQVVFFAVGFETFVPAVAAQVLQGVPENMTFLCSLKTITPAMELLLAPGNVRIDGFITPGHVSTIIGTKPYDLFVDAYRMVVVTAGFQPNDILLALLMAARQLRDKTPKNENEYAGVVRREGNEIALASMAEVFEEATVTWRGIGPVPGGGLKIRPAYQQVDANARFDLDSAVGELSPKETGIPAGCSCNLVIIGKIKPSECALFRNRRCNPQVPIGPCMVSDEGTCRIAALYSDEGED